MKKTLSTLPEIKLVGIKVRTCNKNESNIETAKISLLFRKYFNEQVFQTIANRTNPMITFCAYTDYESDYTGQYTCFIGEEVDSLNKIPDGLEILIISPQKYIKFTTNSGIIPNIVIDSWQEIWQMSSSELGGNRNYHTDFEIYDKRASDPLNSIVDIHVGVN